MSFDFSYKLPTPKEIKEMYPVSDRIKNNKVVMDKELLDIFSGKDDRFIVIIGPCSADNEDSVLKYLSLLKGVEEAVKEKLYIIARIYTNKPRTTGEGYMGMVHQPDPEKDPDLLNGIVMIRDLHMKAMRDYMIPIADEMLYPENYRYLDDVLSYVAVGARSVENQQHRLVASGIPVPVGMKNPTSGTLRVMLNSIYAAQHGHNFIFRGWDVTTSGNPYAHAILRGYENKHGNMMPNYHYEDLMLLYSMYKEAGLKNPAVIVDANHANSGKRYMEQIRIVKEVLHLRQQSTELKSLVKGVMIESYIEEGNQAIGCENFVYGRSITDPCLGFKDSEKLLYEMADLI